MLTSSGRPPYRVPLDIARLTHPVIFLFDDNVCAESSNSEE
jgi:hypothetical protein